LQKQNCLVLFAEDIMRVIIEVLFYFCPESSSVFLPVFVLISCISHIITINIWLLLKQVFHWCWQHSKVKFMH